MIFLENQKGLFRHLKTHFRLPVKLCTTFGPCQNFIYRHHVEPRVKLYSPREESFPIPLKYIDVSRTTHTNLEVKQEKRIDRWVTRLVRSLNRFHTIYFIGTKPSRRIYVVRGEIDEKTADIQSRSFMARNLENNGKECQAEGEAKVVA